MVLRGVQVLARLDGLDVLQLVSDSAAFAAGRRVAPGGHSAVHGEGGEGSGGGLDASPWAVTRKNRPVTLPVKKTGGWGLENPNEKATMDGCSIFEFRIV